MKKIIMSLAMIAAVSAMAYGITTAYFNDVETSIGNTFTAGTIDISVDGQNPWNNRWTNFLDKPCQVSYMTFVIENIGENPANIWKKLTNVVNGPGAVNYCELASSEPEYTEGGGVSISDADGTVRCSGNYVERDNISAFMVYDMAICVIPEGVTEADYCPFITNTSDNPEENKKPDLTSNNANRWKVIIDEDDEVRVDNVVDTWVKLNGELKPGDKMVVSQSYHLMAWDDSGEAMITNWAQGDTMEFDVELEARQLTAPAPGVSLEQTAVAKLIQKDADWNPIVDGASGILTYVVEGEKFKYDFTATGLSNQNYQLIYYPDPWANPKNIVKIGGNIAGITGITTASGNVELGMDLPNSDTGYDSNYPVGAKVWLVPETSLSGNTLIWGEQSQYLFDDGTLVNYDDTQI